MTAEQLSVPVAALKFTTAEHNPVSFTWLMFAGQLIIGACPSFIVTVKPQVAVFPERSVAVSTSFVTPCGNNPPLAIPVVTENVVPVQLSVIVGFGRMTVAVQVPESADCTIFEGQVIVGGTISLIVTLKLQLFVFPCRSVAVNVFNVTPVGKAEPDPNPVVCKTVTAPQLSFNTNEYVTTLSQTPGAVFRSITAGQVMDGRAVSATVNTKEQVDVFPLLSLAENAIV